MNSLASCAIGVAVRPPNGGSGALALGQIALPQDRQRGQRRKAGHRLPDRCRRGARRAPARLDGAAHQVRQGGEHLLLALRRRAQLELVELVGLDPELQPARAGRAVAARQVTGALRRRSGRCSARAAGRHGRASQRRRAASRPSRHIASKLMAEKVTRRVTDRAGQLGRLLAVAAELLELIGVERLPVQIEQRGRALGKGAPQREGELDQRAQIDVAVAPGLVAQPIELPPPWVEPRGRREEPIIGRRDAVLRRLRYSMHRTVTATATSTRSASKSRCGGVPRSPVGQRTSNWTASKPVQPASGSWSGRPARAGRC